MRLLIVCVIVAFVSQGCSKLPESDAAKKMGQQPKQLIDKATTDVNKAVQQGADSLREAERKQEADGKP